MRGGRRCRKEVALFCSGAPQFFFVVTDALARVIVFETGASSLASISP